MFFSLIIKRCYVFKRLHCASKMANNWNDRFKEGYVLLGLATYNLSISEINSILLSSEDIEKLNKFCITKTKSKVNHHSDATGKIFSLGYGPKYEKKDKYGYSIGIFTDKTNKLKRKKFNEEITNDTN